MNKDSKESDRTDSMHFQLGRAMGLPFPEGRGTKTPVLKKIPSHSPQGEKMAKSEADQEIIGTLTRVGPLAQREDDGPPARGFVIRTSDRTEITLKATSLHSFPVLLGNTYRFLYSDDNWVTAIEAITYD